MTVRLPLCARLRGKQRLNCENQNRKWTVRLCSLVSICSFPQLAKTVDAGAVGVAVKSLRDKREPR